jgi:hypothetical protein
MNPKQARAKSAKRSKNQTNPENRKKSLLDPGRHFPVPYFVVLLAHLDISKRKKVFSECVRNMTRQPESLCS